MNRAMAWRRAAFPFLILALWTAATCSAAEPGTPHAGWTFSCRADNDLYRAVTAAGADCPRFDAPMAAVQAAPAGSGLLILADGYPEKPTVVPAGVFEIAARKQLRLYVEYADRLPGLEFGPPKDVKYERGVVVSEFFGPSLPKQRIVLVSSCRFLPVKSPTAAHLAAAKVAGVDTAVYGLANTPAEPLLFEHPQANVLVATTALSHFIRGRYLPTDDWRTIWQAILASLHPRQAKIALKWMPTVRPSYGRGDLLPADYAAQAVRRSADWIVASRSLRHRDWPAAALALSSAYNTVRDMPSPGWPAGDGSYGILEGFSSTIRRDGSQPMRYAVRNDCSMEAAMLLAMDASLNSRPENARRAANLVNYILGESGLAGGTRADPKSPTYGLIGWALDSPHAYWGDDNGRAILGAAAAAALSGEKRWNDALARCILANFRTTGASGFRQECIDEKSLAARGWTSFYSGRAAWHSPHHQAWPWACYLWAYRQSSYAPLLDRTKAGIRAAMQAYPRRWNWILRSGTMERSRMLIALAWLVRVDDTPEHRRWLRTMAEDLIALQDPCGAVREIIGDGGPGLRSNAEYGTGEISLIQSSGDTVCDMLYSCNFALIGLIEAAAATSDPQNAQAAERLVRFLARIQARSESHPELDGAWYRAFDYRRWDYWASSADWEWGPWCMETGWSQPWIVAGLTLHARRTSLWDLLAKVDIAAPLRRYQPQMLPAAVVAAIAAREPPRTAHAARDKPVHLTAPPDPRYPGAGESTLVDGELAPANYQSPQWLGFYGDDLEAVIDLESVVPVRAVAVRCLQSVDVGIFLPAGVEIALSLNGKDFKPAMRVDRPGATAGLSSSAFRRRALLDKPAVAPGATADRGPLIRTLRAELASEPARWLRVRVRNVRVMPTDPPAAARKAWLFVDELMVNP